jgi:hypothetical protein
LEKKIWRTVFRVAETETLLITDCFYWRGLPWKGDNGINGRYVLSYATTYSNLLLCWKGQVMTLSLSSNLHFLEGFLFGLKIQNYFNFVESFLWIDKKTRRF